MQQRDPNGQTSIITYKDNLNCTATATVTVDVPSISGTLGICKGATVALTGASSGTPNATSPWTSATTTVATVSGTTTAGTAGALTTATNGQTSVISL
jgi:hypothetical protein